MIQSDRMRELRREPAVFFEDPGHGWLKASYKDLVELGIEKKITGFSYRQADDVYLEEDLDLTTYLKALWGSLYHSEMFKLWWRMVKETHYEDIFIRNLPSYE